MRACFATLQPCCRHKYQVFPYAYGSLTMLELELTLHVRLDTIRPDRFHVTQVQESKHFFPQTLWFVQLYMWNSELVRNRTFRFWFNEVEVSPLVFRSSVRSPVQCKKRKKQKILNDDVCTDNWSLHLIPTSHDSVMKSGESVYCHKMAFYIVFGKLSTTWYVNKILNTISLQLWDHFHNPTIWFSFFLHFLKL